MSIRSLLSFLSLSVLLGCKIVFADDRMDSTIAEYLADTLFNNIVDGADAVEDLSAEGPWTIFAPTDAAIYDFIALYPTAAEFLSETVLVRQLLDYHIVEAEEILASDLTDGMVITTAMGDDITVNIGNDSASLTADNGEANIDTTDILLSNGVIHTIDKVIIPPPIRDFLNNPVATTDSPSVSPTALTASPSSSLSTGPTTSPVPTAAPIPSAPIPSAPIPSAPTPPAPTPSAPTTSAGVPQVVTCVGTVITMCSALALM